VKLKAFVTWAPPDPALEMLRAGADVDLWTGELPAPREVILERVRDADGLLCLLTDRVDQQLIDAAPKLKVVSNYAVGVDNIDVPAATARGVRVGNTPGVLTETAADLAFALILATARRIVEADKHVRSCGWRTWEPALFLGQDVHGATIGIVGMGRIGAEVARRARGFSMRILYTERHRHPELEEELAAEYVGLDTLLRESDFVSLHCPLTAETRHLIGERELGLMKHTAILINTARGPVVDQEALYGALKDKRIFAAGLDVFEQEPVDCHSPLMAQDNVTVIPHIASASVATRTRMAVMAAENLLAGLRGESLPNQVNEI
jgi:lactate dehydrogenase-like 2-hydroxyacid dehydrogenase